MSLTREQLVQLTNQSPDMIIATDVKGRIIYYNAGAEKSLGYTSDETIGEFVGTFYPSVEEARRVGDAMRSPEQGGEGVVNTLETSFVCPSNVSNSLPFVASQTCTV